MKKKYILIFAGIIPLLFSFFILNFFLKDDRKKLFESAKILEEGFNNNFIIGDLVKFSGSLSDKNLYVKGEYLLAVKERFVKGQNGKRSEWIRDEFYLQPIWVKIQGLPEVEILVADDYLPCGDGIKISNIEPKKSRVIGMPLGLSISAVGKIISTNPMKVQTGHSLCTGTIEDYKEYINKKWIGYIFILLCISIPSFGLIYLGLFRVSNEV